MLSSSQQPTLEKKESEDEELEPVKLEDLKEDDDGEDDAPLKVKEDIKGIVVMNEKTKGSLVESEHRSSITPGSSKKADIKSNQAKANDRK